MIGWGKAMREAWEISHGEVNGRREVGLIREMSSCLLLFGDAGADE